MSKNGLPIHVEKWILYPGTVMDQSQNLADSCQDHNPLTHQVSRKSVHNFLSNLVNRQTDKPKNKSENITSVAEVISYVAVAGAADMV